MDGYYRALPSDDHSLWRMPRSAALWGRDGGRAASYVHVFVLLFNLLVLVLFVAAFLWMNYSKRLN
jgi:hypothetical protein